MNIILITAIEPNYYNKNGPSGLLWEIVDYLKNTNINIDVSKVDLSADKINRIVQRLGMNIKPTSMDLSKYDIILFYPSFIASIIPEKYYKKTFSLGPDSDSLVFYSFFKKAITWKKYVYLLMAKWFINYEKKWIKRGIKLIVVGEKDRKWISLHNKKEKNNIFYLHHPLLISSLSELTASPPEKIRFIFSGDLSECYVGDYIDRLVNEINLINKKILNILVVGKRNKSIYEKLCHINDAQVEYIEWIEDYSDLCNVGYDVHCIPLVAGGGTKNRVMTAIANGVKVISTSIGLDNIPYSNLFGVYKAKSEKEFAGLMIKNNSISQIDDSDIDIIIKERKQFKTKIDKEFQSLFLIGCCVNKIERKR